MRNSIELKNFEFSVEKEKCNNCEVETFCVDVSSYKYESQPLCELCLREIVDKFVDWQNAYYDD